MKKNEKYKKIFKNYKLTLSMMVVNDRQKIKKIKIFWKMTKMKDSYALYKKVKKQLKIYSILLPGI
jgi:hypothetical protein